MFQNLFLWQNRFFLVDFLPFNDGFLDLNIFRILFKNNIIFLLLAYFLINNFHSRESHNLFDGFLEYLLKYRLLIIIPKLLALTDYLYFLLIFSKDFRRSHQDDNSRNLK